MSEVFIEITEEQFDESYPLLTNHLNPNASWAFGNDNGCLFETYGEELSYVIQQDRDCIWTLVDGDDGDQYLISGYHLVNRIGYLITQDRVPKNTCIQVRIPCQQEEFAEQYQGDSL